MTYLEAFLLGLVQGLTEFLPVSSSGHLALFRILTGSAATEAGGDAELAFDVVLHLGTLVSVVIAFRATILRLLRERRDLILPIILATACLGLALIPVGDGLKLKDFVKTARNNGLFLGGGFLLTAGFLTALITLERRRDGKGESGLQAISPARAIIVGLFQLVAILPGVSRSGSTLAGAVISGGERRLSFEFAFLLAIPAILGAGVLEARHIHDLSKLAMGPLLLGFFTSMLTGIGAISLVDWLLRRDRLWIFVPYLLLCAALAFIFG